MTYIRAAEPLTKAEFLAHCHWRNPEFRAFALRLWRELPPVLRKARPRPDYPRVVDVDTGEVLFPKPRPAPIHFPVEPEPLHGDYFALRPKTFTEYAQVSRTLVLLLAMADWWEAVSFKTPEYPIAINRERGACDEALAEFRRECSERWPRWAAGRLAGDPHEGNWWKARPDVVVRRRPHEIPGDGPLRAIPAGADAFRAAVIWLPVYEDTHAGSVDWEAVAQLQSKIYGRQQRSRGEDYYTLLLCIWDLAYDQRRTFGEIARELAEPESTIKSRALVVGKIILGTQDARAVTKALRALPTVDTDLQGCAICSKATSVDEFCPQHRELVEQDQPGRGRRSRRAK